VLKSEIIPNKEYAARERRMKGAAIQHVRVLAHVRGNKWKVEWIDPNPGLVDYLESGQLIAPWKERRAFLKEELNREQLSEHNLRHGYVHGEAPLESAVQQVFESVGDDIHFHKGSLSGTPDALGRLATRAGRSHLDAPPISYVDRGGTVHLPYDFALLLAQELCATEPATVLVSVDSTEREWTRDAVRGESHLVGLLAKYRPSWALIRQWAGYDAALAQRQAEIDRLERLVLDAIYCLQKAGLDREAAKLRRLFNRE
jgi:hypothetical protein